MTKTSDKPISVVVTYFASPDGWVNVASFLKDSGQEILVDSRLVDISTQTVVVQVIRSVDVNEKESIVRELAFLSRQHGAIWDKLKDKNLIGVSEHWFIERDSEEQRSWFEVSSQSVPLDYGGSIGNAYFTLRPNLNSNFSFARTLVGVPPDDLSLSSAILLVARPDRSADAVLTSIDLVSHKATWLIGNALSRSLGSNVQKAIDEALDGTQHLMIKLSKSKVAPAEYRQALRYQARIAAIVGVMQITKSLLNPVKIQASEMTYANLRGGGVPNFTAPVSSKNEHPIPVMQLNAQINTAETLLEKYADVHSNLKAIGEASQACREYDQAVKYNRIQVGVATASAAVSVAALFERETAIAFWRYFGIPSSELLTFLTELIATCTAAFVIYLTAHFWVPDAK
jgi:hypothetical protein